MSGDKKWRGSLNSPASACAELRAAYHDCFNRWYAEKFSKGQWDENCCSAEWEKYRACLTQHLDDKHLRPLLMEDADSTDHASPDKGSNK